MIIADALSDTAIFIVFKHPNMLSINLKETIPLLMPTATLSFTTTISLSRLVQIPPDDGESRVVDPTQTVGGFAANCGL